MNAPIRTMQNPTAIPANSARRFPIRPFWCRSRKSVLFRTRKRALTVPIKHRMRAMMGTVSRPAGPFDPTGERGGSMMVRTSRITATSANGANVRRKERTGPIIIQGLNDCVFRRDPARSAVPRTLAASTGVFFCRLSCTTMRTFSRIALMSRTMPVPTERIVILVGLGAGFGGSAAGGAGSGVSVSPEDGSSINGSVSIHERSTGRI